jgi:hypothetical protein
VIAAVICSAFPDLRDRVDGKLLRGQKSMFE